MSVQFEEQHLVVAIGKRVAHVPFVMEHGVVVASLDEVAEWAVPEGEAIGIDDLGRIAAAIEKAFDAKGMDVEFE